MNLGENSDRFNKVWGIILRFLEPCDERNNARLVCTSWKNLINKDTIEKLLIPWDVSFKRKNWSVLIDSEWRHVHYYISQSYGNLQESDEFFVRHRHFITSLHISKCPFFELSELKMILSDCHHLQRLTISEFEYKWFGQMHEEEVTNHSLTHLILNPSPFRSPITPLEMIDAIDHIRNVLPRLKRLEIENVKYFPDATQLRTLQNKRYNMVILGTDMKNNHFRICKHIDIQYVNIKYADFTLNKYGNTSTINFTLPLGLTEKSLLEFMIQHNNLEILTIDFTTWNCKTLNFPPIGYNISQSKLSSVKIIGVGTVVLGHCPALFKNLKVFIVDSCEVENFSPEIIAQMTNMERLSVNISYPAYNAICEHMRLLEALTIGSSSDSDSDSARTDTQKHLKKLKKLEYLRGPNLLDSEEE